MHVIGTAGHVDHGKSTLVRALTGIDPDRLREEKEREMTIDLGFAWLQLPPSGGYADEGPGEMVGVIDVPGHIDFIKNMLAGVGGIDAAVFVVAADEGVMPQTREHLAILDLLQVPAGVIALTKVDAVTDADWLDLVEADLRDTVSATCLAQAPVIRVSARTGFGLTELKHAIAGVLDTVPLRVDRGLPRLPIDRAFSVAGFGTVVTGTLSDGAFQVGEEVEIIPGGLRARIRGLQTHKKSVTMGLPGNRVAINLTGVHPDQLARGMVVARPATLQPTELVDVRLRVVGSSLTQVSGEKSTLRHNQLVDLFSGASEVPARLRLLQVEEIPPGGTGWAQLRLEAPVVLSAGDHFIVRQASPSLTVGGGQVVNPHPARRWRRFQPEVIAQLEALARGTPDDLFLHALAAIEPAPLKVAVERSGLDAGTAETTVASLLEVGQVVLLGQASSPLRSSNAPAISSGGWRTLTARILETLTDYHAQYPLRPGMVREELKSRIQGRGKPAPAAPLGSGWSTKLFNEIMSRADAQGVVEEAGDFICRPGHRIAFSPDQQARVDTLLALFAGQPYSPPSLGDSTNLTSSEIISALLYQGVLVRLSDDVLLRRETYEEMVAAIVAFIKDNGSMTVAQVRDRFSTSRRYALAIMEHLDERKVTRRVGDERVLR